MVVCVSVIAAVRIGLLLLQANTPSFIETAALYILPPCLPRNGSL